MQRKVEREAPLAEGLNIFQRMVVVMEREGVRDISVIIMRYVMLSTAALAQHCRRRGLYILPRPANSNAFPITHFGVIVIYNM